MYARPPPNQAPQKSRTGFAIFIFALFLLIGAGGAAAFFNRDALFGGLATKKPPSAPPPIPPKIPIGPPIASGRAAISIKNGGSVSLPSGARADIAAGAISADTEIVFTRVATPQIGAADRSKLIGDEAYHLATTKHVIPDGDVTLALPIPASVTKLDSVTVYAFNGRTLYPVRSKLDAARRLLIVTNPSVTELSATAKYRPLRQEQGQEAAAADADAAAPTYLDIDYEDAGAPEPLDIDSMQGLQGLQQGMQGVQGITGGRSAEPPTAVNLSPVDIYQVGYMVPYGTCVTGNVGETLEKPNHVFSIVFETKSSCKLANLVSDYLQEAYDVYARDYRSTDGKSLPPLRQFTPQKRMEIFITPLEGGVNGEYEFRSWNGFIAVDPAKAENPNDLSREEERRKQALRNTLYHELFHAVQNRYRNLLVQAVNGGRWWIEATAERAAQKVRKLDFETAANEAITEYGKHVMSVPLEQAGSFGDDATLPYGHAIFVGHVEKTSPNYIRDTLNGSIIASGSYFQSLVTAGKLEDTYDDFARDLLARAPKLAPWTRGRMMESETETRALRPSLATYGSPEGTPTRITEKAERGKPQRFRFLAGPMTTHFLVVQSQSSFKPGRSVEITPALGSSDRVKPPPIGDPSKLAQGFAMMVPTAQSTPGPVQLQPLPIGTKTTIGGLGETSSVMWIAFANTHRTGELMFDVDIALKSEAPPPEVAGSFQPTDPTRVIAGMPPMRKASSVLEGRHDAPGKTWTIDIRRVQSPQIAKDAMTDYEKSSKKYFPARWDAANTPTTRDNAAQTCTPSNECSYTPDLVIDALSSICVRKSTSNGTSGTGSDGMLDMQALYRDVWLIKMRIIASSTDPKPPWPKGSAAATVKEVVDNAKKLIDERFPPTATAR